MKNLFLVAVLLLPLLTYAAETEVGVNPDSLCSIALEEKALNVLRENDFIADRGLHTYLVIFGEKLAQKLQAMNGHSHWLDAGSGSAYFAKMLFDPEIFELEYLNEDVFSNVFSHVFRRIELGLSLSKEEWRIFNYLKSIFNLGYTRSGKPKVTVAVNDLPNITGITYKLSADDPTPPEHKFHKGKFRLFHGRLFEDIPLGVFTEKFGKADLITDLYGVFAYSTNPASILEKYLKLLSNKGQIHILIGPKGSYSNLETHMVQTKSGEKISLLAWVNQLQGISVEFIETKIFGRGHTYQSILIKKTTKNNVGIPKLKILDLDSEQMPPVRFFEEQ